MTKLERYEEFFCKALLVLGPYAFRVGEPYLEQAATLEQMKYIREFAELARVCGFDPDRSVDRKKNGLSTLFTDYFYYWRGEHKLFPNRMVDHE